MGLNINAGGPGAPSRCSRPESFPGNGKGMAATIKTRAFLVGCPRSGTTLLQSMLFANPDIYTFPETHFFEAQFGVNSRHTLGQRSRRLSRRLFHRACATMLSLGIVDPWRAARAWKQMQVLPNFAAAAQHGKSISLRSNAQAFVELADAATIGAGRQVWVEKTPYHLYCIKHIQQYIPSALFIHIIRNGPDTVGSLVDAGSKFPGQFGKKLPASQSLVEMSIKQWNAAVEESLRYRGDPRHYLLRYEDLVSDPIKVLSGVCEFLDCDFDEKMVTDYSRQASRLILETEPWKKSTAGPIRNTRDTKFRELFSASEQKYILSNVVRFTH